MRSATVAGSFALVLSLGLAGGAAAAWRSEGPFVGNLHDLACDSAHPDTIYAASSGGGVWRSDDGGATWTLPGGEMTSRKVEWVEVDPANASTVWAGIDNPGEPALWRSRDRGASWELVAGPVKGELGAMSPTGVRIAFAPSAPTTIFVPSTNLHYRSTDGGRSWSDFRVPGQDAYAMAIDPQNPKVVYAGGRGEKLHFSRSEDGGKTWKQTGQGLPERSIHALRVTPKSGTTLYAAVGFAELFTSTDRGDTWQSLPSPAQGTDDLYNLALDPNDPRALWAATENGLFRSSDGGQTWTPTDRGTGRYLCTDVALDPRDAQRVLAATGGAGVYRSTDGGRTWAPSSTGLAAGWVERLWVPPHAGRLFARTASGLFRRDDTGAWSEIGAPFAERGQEAKSTDSSGPSTAARRGPPRAAGSPRRRSATWRSTRRPRRGCSSPPRGDSSARPTAARRGPRSARGWRATTSKRSPSRPPARSSPASSRGSSAAPTAVRPGRR